MAGCQDSGTEPVGGSDAELIQAIIDADKISVGMDGLPSNSKIILDEEYNEYSQTHTAHRDDDARVRKINEDYEKERALKRVREGYYENKFSKSQREKTSGSGKGSDSLCVYGDS